MNAQPSLQRVAHELKSAVAAMRIIVLALTSGTTMFLLAAVALPVGLLLAGDNAARPRTPNLVFIMADDLGYGDLGCYGQKRIKTPNIDHLAAEGIRLTQYYAGSAVCAPSRCVLMTGLHPGHGFIRDNRAAPSPEPRDFYGDYPIPADTRTLADEFKSRGYVTGGFGKWGLGGPISTGDPLKHGFDQFFGYLGQWQAHNHYPQFIFKNGEKFPLNNPPIDVHERLPQTFDAKDPAGYRRFIGSDYVPDRLAEEALRFIDQHAGEPFFLYYPTTLPHLALQVPEESLAEYRGQWRDPPYPGNNMYSPHFTPRAAYAAMITRMDRDVGRLLRALTDRGLAEQSVVVFTSDNGPVYDQIGGTDSDFFQSAHGLRGLKGSLYEGGIRVPCIVRWTGHIPAGKTSDFVVGAEDWYATLPRLMGLGGELPAGLDGIDVSPTLLGVGQPPRPLLYREFPNLGGQQSLRVGNWKAIRQHLMPAGEGVEPDLTIALYDLGSDPGETKNVAGNHPDVVAQMERLMREQHKPAAAEFAFPALDRS